MNRIVLFLLFTAANFLAHSQTEQSFSTELYGPQSFNPASYGTWNKFSAGAGISSKFQNVVSFNSVEFRISLKKEDRDFGAIGVGALYSYQSPRKSAYIDRHHIGNLSINYQLKLGKTRLALGVSPGIANYRFFDFWPSADINTTEFTLGAGVQWYSDFFYLSVYATNLNGVGLDHTTPLVPTYNAEGVFRFRLTRNFELLPRLRYRNTAGSFHALSMDVLADIKKAHLRIGGGLNVREGLSVSAYTYFKKFELGYNLSLPISALNSSGWPGHELRLSYRIPNSFRPDFKVITTPPF